jgi:CBS domain containing-hemolysin-like protein
MTLMNLFLSEITPKTIGAVYWRSLAGFTARFVRGLICALYTLIWVSEAQDRGDVKLETLKRELKTVPGNVSLSIDRKETFKI